MKKFVSAVTVGLFCVGGALAYPLNWFAGGGVALPPTGGNATGWVLAIFRDGGNGSIDGFGPGGASTGDDLLVLTQANPGPVIGWYALLGNAAVPGGVNIFTAIFNETSLANVDNESMYVVPDLANAGRQGYTASGMFIVPANQTPTPPNKDYDCGMVSNGQQWQPVPEPSAMALMALGLATLAARRIRRK